MATITACSFTPDSVLECGGVFTLTVDVTIQNTTFDFVTVTWEVYLNGEPIGQSQTTVEGNSSVGDSLSVSISNSGDNCISPGEYDVGREIIDEQPALL